MFLESGGFVTCVDDAIYTPPSRASSREFSHASSRPRFRNPDFIQHPNTSRKMPRAAEYCVPARCGLCRLKLADGEMIVVCGLFETSISLLLRY